MENKKFVIKDKKLFAIGVGILLTIGAVGCFLELIGVVIVSKFFEGLIDVILTLGAFTMMYISTEHNLVINLFYCFIIFVGALSIILCFVNMFQ